MPVSQAEQDFRSALEAQGGGRFEEAVQLLARAGAADHVLALSMLGGQLMSGRGVQPDLPSGLTLMRRAADLGGAYAWAVLAATSAFGLGRKPDWATALDQLQRSAELGHAPAQEQLRMMAELSGPAGATDDWAALRRNIDLGAWRAPAPAQTLSADPEIRVAPGLATPSVCAWLISRVRDRLQPVTAHDTTPFRPAGADDRGHSFATFTLADGDVVTLLLRERLAAAAGLDPANMEGAQVLHYAPGEQYAPHYDFLDPAVAGHAAWLSRWGQRVATCLVYLNGDFEGGETAFPALGTAFRGGVGDGLLFRNVDKSGAPDERTLHAGLPPTAGEKWLFSQWVRERPFYS